MSEMPTELRYTESHEWVSPQEDGSYLVGITDHAQESLGELVYVELPEAGSAVTRGEACAVVESVKAASDIYSPVDGEVVEANDALVDSPDLVNTSPYEDGWIMRIRPSDPTAFDELLDAERYAETLED